MSRSFAETLLSLHPTTRRYVQSYHESQQMVRALDAEKAETAAALDAAKSQAQVDGDAHTSREIQIAAATHTPLLTSELVLLENGTIATYGVAIAPDGLFENVSFFFNGRRADKIKFPI